MTALSTFLRSEPDVLLAAGGFIVGVGFGAAASASNFCVMGALADWRSSGHRARLGAVALAAAVAVAGAQILDAAGFVTLSRSMYLAPQLNWAGALLGGYASVELAKRYVGWTRPTGDLFALTVPLSLAIGRVGCVLAGCCQGIACDDAWYAAHDATGHARWPAPAVELLFNAAFFAWAIAASRFGWQRTQRFHVYLIAYGAFRFGHEFLRDDPRWFGPISGYHAVALGLIALGVWRYRVRARRSAY